MKDLRLILVPALSGWLAVQHSLAQLPQIPPESYATTHFLGSPAAIDLGHAAMGAACAADSRAGEGWHGNPAGVASLSRPEVVLEYHRAGLDGLPDIDAGMLAIGFPLMTNVAMKLTYARVRSSGRIPSTPLDLEAAEDDPGIEVGWRVTDRLKIGAAFSYLLTESTYEINGAEVTKLTSKPDGVGGRVGAIYDFCSWFSVGGALDIYREVVTRKVPGQADELLTFDSEVIRLGVAFHPDQKTTILADYLAPRLEGADSVTDQNTLLWGAARWVGPVALRVGQYDGEWTGGLGLETGLAQISYAYSKRLRSDMAAVGGDETHSVELRWRF